MSFRCILLVVLLASASAPAVAADSFWSGFKERFATADGRVVDTANGGVSHSEGQGYGMLLAVAHDDRPAFERIWSWTRTRLAIRGDGLLAWRWSPEKRAVDDPNAASDGDVLVAWALLRAHARWGEARHLEAARAGMRAIDREVVARIGGLTVILPGPDGFAEEDGVVVNPSYWIFPAFEAFAETDPDGPWRALNADGAELLTRASFGERGLTPDWVALGRDGGVALASGFEPVWGYNAVRVPMHLVWDGRAAHPAAGAPAPEGSPPATRINLETGEILERADDPGYAAVRALVACRDPLAGAEPAEHYYPAALQLLAALAFEEGGAC